MNTFEPLNPALIDAPLPADCLTDGHSGYVDDGGDTTDAMKDCCGAASRDFPKSLLIEPKDWSDKARENDKSHTWPMNYLDRYTNQAPSHQCTCESLAANVTISWNRQRGIIFPEGPKKNFRYPESAIGSFWPSVLSVYSEANPRQWGGANVRQVMEIACRRGMLPDKIQPREYNFKHTLTGSAGKGNNNQSSGNWVPLSQFPEGWKETAKHFRPLEVIFPESWEQAVCLVLNGYAVSVGRSGHAVPWTQAMFDGNTFKAMAYADSYDITRYDSAGTVRGAWGGSFAIATMTAPDDWNAPAGN
jgi:hypothetical protein